MTADSEVGAGFVQRQKLFMLPKKVQKLSVPYLFWDKTRLGLHVIPTE